MSENRDLEFLSTERLRFLVPLTGDIEQDAIKNLQAMLSRELTKDTKFRIKAANIYEEDTDAMLPAFPAICLDYKGSESEQKTIGKEMATFVRNVFVDLFYYYADVSSSFRMMELSIMGGRIISVLQRNADINGYCRLGVRLQGGGSVVDKIKGAQVLKAFRIGIRIPVVYRDRSAGPS